MKCPRCGEAAWVVTGDTHDTVEYYVDLHEDGSFDTTAVKDEYVGETDWWGFAECDNCGYKLDTDTMESFLDEE